MTACGSCDNCGFLLLLNVLLNVSVRKQAYRRRRGQQGGGGECGKQGRRLIGWRSADSREEREWEGPGFHQMQDLRRASPNRVSTQGVLFHPLNECEERNRSRGIRDCGRDSSPQQKIPHLEQNGNFFFLMKSIWMFSHYLIALMLF